MIFFRNMYQISSNLRELQHFRYAGVPYIIAGLKSNQLKTKEHEEFDKKRTDIDRPRELFFKEVQSVK